MSSRSTHSALRTPHSPRLGYLVKAFPRISETFILNEVLELERQGFDLRLYALNRPRDAKRHALADQVALQLGDRRDDREHRLAHRR